MFGLKKEDIPGDITDKIEHRESPISQADVKPAQNPAALSAPPAMPAPLPKPEVKTPMLSGIESDEQGKMMEQRKQPATPPLPPSSTPGKPFKQIKGPVFISLKKYKELRADLDELKHTSVQLKSVLARMKENRDSGFDLLEKSTDTLLKLEEQSEAVNNLMKN